MEKKRDSFFLQKKEKGNKVQNEKFKTKSERQKAFDGNRNGVEEKEKTEKKPFDKKTYRLKKYSKKYKLEQWEEQRKKKLIHDYQKSMKNEQMAGKYVPKAFDDEPDSATVGRFVRHPDLIDNDSKKNKNRDPFSKAKEQYNKVRQEKEEKKAEKERVKEERERKLQEYKKKKHERFKKLSKKNKKGQPMMTGRMELLLEKIQRGS